MKNWVIGALLVLLGAAAYYYFSSHQAAESEVTVLKPVPVDIPAPVPDSESDPIPVTPEVTEVPDSGFEPAIPPLTEEIHLPTLMDSDPLVLNTMAGLIGEPAVIRYLVSDNVISRIVATVDTMGSQQIPGVVQVVQGPESDFEAIRNDQPESLILNEEGDPIPQFTIDPANYERYTPYIELLEAVDTSQMLSNYRSYYPLFQVAFRQMGYAEGEFNQRLIAVIDELLATPEVSDPVNLVKPEAFFLLTDPDLESRPAGQKILLRMGTENATRVKQKLLEIRGGL